MDKFNILDCTLRDGGYINKWRFSDVTISEMIEKLIRAGIDFVEVGYLNNAVHENNLTQFDTIEKIERFIPRERKDCILLAMADVQQFTSKDLTDYTGKSIEGIRVVFYKHQIEEAMTLASAVKEKGYKLFMQPMVTIDYSINEYAKLTKRIAELEPYAVSIVDSFGYMLKEDFRRYFKILDNLLDNDVIVGFHSHNNMNLAFISAQDILEYNTERRLVLDASLYGMGRGAGNLNTELIANYYNMTLGQKYDINYILDLISEHIMPIYKQREWGYSPYLFITGLYHYHPNFACYLLEDYDVSVSEFEAFIHTIPDEMKTRCKKPYVIEMWKKFKEGKKSMPKIVAIMPIKLNNERLPGKNIRLLGEKPLLRYELDSLLQISEIDNIYVYCSDIGICDYLPEGVDFIERPKCLDLPTSNFSQIFESFMEKVDADIYVYAHATAPFVEVNTIKKEVNAVLSGEYDSAFCAVKIQDYLWKNGKPLNFNAENVPRSQDIEPIYRETSGVYVFKKEVFQKYHRRIGENALIQEVGFKEAVDINTPEDFKLAEIMLTIGGGYLTNHLTIWMYVHLFYSHYKLVGMSE